MSHTYAGILGTVAFTLVLARGAACGGHADVTLTLATASLFLFAAIGYVAGRIADSIVLQAVKARFDAELKSREEAT